ncbi:response regulator transcription factor [Clostridium sp. MB40-C1]|uniref:response regulator transcription factor n=1 Tax=Clostridium sp. MB40-C1 TaxID=3070996 RepID=UPI0027E15B8D|nr:response regulator transcription factor [Clostridium sp. MB40-C1]WMJ79464.1 response regulator transcription factor [Clostridium sp. MB40-C1]
MAIKVLIADDDALIRESLKIILEMTGEIEVSKCVENGYKAVEGCLNNDIDVAILDVRMPVMNGVEAIKDIVSKTDTRALILTTFDEDEYIYDAIKYGSKGYILKNNPPDTIINAIKTVYNGNTVMEDLVLDKIIHGLNDSVNNSIDDTLFTERELEVIVAISEGLSNKEIAKKLYISEGTVKNYISNILSKTGLNHRTQIAIYYLKGKF